MAQIVFVVSMGLFVSRCVPSIPAAGRQSTHYGGFGVHMLLTTVTAKAPCAQPWPVPGHEYLQAGSPHGQALHMMNVVLLLGAGALERSFTLAFGSFRSAVATNA
ncbi:MAG: hypothetical protein HYX69_16090 [Planctomycetia bacterium]|nr:hypothetical protein [Planctomycetia bacterium]